ncbi:MAG TPA: redoxin family protein [Planctomycetota bacterium]|nr:redoxin family protein [Planctomycetota bacterium]
MRTMLCAIALAATAAHAQETTLKVGDAAPPLSIAKWVKGDPVTIEQGKTYVVEFWATWCGPCVAGMPHLSELQERYKDKVTFVGVTSEDKLNTLEAVQKMVESKGPGMGYTVAWDDAGKTNDAYMRAARQNGIPCSFVVDGSGKVAYIGHPATLDVVLARVAAGKWDAEKGPAELGQLYQRINEIFQMDGAMAAPALATFEKEHPELAPTLEEPKFHLMLRLGKTEEVSAIGAKIVEKAVKYNSPEKLNEIAWTIVDPEQEIKSRDVDLAMRAAEKAVELTKGEEGAILDTLARCYHWKGDLEKAIEIQTKAVEKAADDPEMLGDLQRTLDSYKAEAAEAAGKKPE